MKKHRQAYLLAVGIVFWIKRRVEMFEVGQKVWDVVRGEGIVVDVKPYDCKYPVVVNFARMSAITYTEEGKDYTVHEKPSIYPYPVEVVKKVTKPSIDWEHVHKDFKFLAKDIDGNAFLYWEKPVLVLSGGWQTTQGDCAEAHQFASYTSGTCDWQDSLVERP